MKKNLWIVIIAIIVIIFVILINCGIKNNNEFSTDLEGVYNAIITEQPKDKVEELVLFKETNEDLINSYYEGLANIDLLEKNIYMHPVGHACEIALVKVSNINDIETVENIFKERIKIGTESTMCDWETKDIWKRRAEIQTRGNYVCLIVLPDGYNIPKDIFSLDINPNNNNEKETSVDYKSIYEEKLNTLEVDGLYSEYALYDLDGDNIPEMIVKQGMSEANTMINVYDIIDGQLIVTNIKEFGGHTNIVGAVDINSIIFQYGQGGYEKVAVLHYNKVGTYTLEVIKDAELEEGIGYIPFEPLKMYTFDDKEGLEWNQNPDDENYWYINAGNAEV